MVRSLVTARSGVAQLIDLANQDDGPDNIACAVADIVELHGHAPGPENLTRDR
jgi:serine/threonine protein phosphatase PrpC